MRASVVCLTTMALLMLIGACVGGASQVVRPTATLNKPLQPTLTNKEFVLPPSTPNPKCSPPCFYGIIPGRTTATETLSILGATLMQIDTPVDGSLSWKTKAPARSWYVPEQMIYNDINFQDGMVHSIVLVQEQDMTLKNVVDQYGQPEAIAIGYPYGVTLADILLTYPSQGIAFVAEFSPASEKKEDSSTPLADMLVDRRVYFAPMKAADLTPQIVSKWRASGSIDGVYPWHGFGKPVR